MARRVLADFDSEILKRLANRSDISSTQRGFFLHDAYLWVCKSFLHPEIEASTTGVCTATTDTITPVATDVWWYEVVQDSDNGKVLDPGDKDVIENMIKQAGTPRKYYWWNSQLKTDRKPASNTNYLLLYIKKVPEITTSPLIDQLFDPVIIMKAAEIGLATVRDFKEAQALTTQIDHYVKYWSLPKREAKKNMTSAGARPRFR